VELREKEDRDKLNSVRTIFYQINERFEQLLKFRPLRKVESMRVEMDLEAAYSLLQAFRMEACVFSLEEQVKGLETQLDLKEYYDIKRPTVVFFA
jgi:hypothetical protein